MESQSLGHAELCLTASSRLFGVCRRQTGCAFRHVEPIRKELKHDGKRRNRRKKNTAELNDGDETRRKEQKITLNTLHVANRLIIPPLFMISLFVPSPLSAISFLLVYSLQRGAFAILRPWARYRVFACTCKATNRAKYVIIIIGAVGQCLELWYPAHTNTYNRV